MNKYKNKILVLLLIALTPMLHAQVYVGAGTGVYSLNNNYDNLNVSNDMGYNLRVGYVKMFTSKIGVGIGAEYTQSKNFISTNDRFSLATNLVDDATSAFVYNVTTDGYKESQELSAIHIPLFIQFKTKISEKASFYARGGAKYFMPQKFKASASATQITATGFYPDFNLLITNEPTRGFGTTNGYSESGEYETQNIVMLNFEVGFSFVVSGDSSIYVGFFLDRGTESIVKSKNDVSFIGYNPTSTTGRKLNGLYNSRLDGEVIPVNFGINLSYSFGK